jgi:protein MpaA
MGGAVDHAKLGRSAERSEESRMSRRPQRIALIAVAASLAGALGTAATAIGHATPPHSRGPSKASTAGWFKPYRVDLGTTPRGNHVYSYRIAKNPGKPNVLIIGTMHGDEPAGRHVGYALIRAVQNKRFTIRGVNLWVVPAMNPDGYRAHTRQNAHHVDLNRNFPYEWVPLSGATYSGPHASSEVETRFMETLLRNKSPRFVVSMHQPLNSVDSDNKSPGLADRLHRYLHLPMSNLNCGGKCHGTMTGWYNHRFAGAAITIEFSSRAVVGDQALRYGKRIVFAELAQTCNSSGYCQSAP